MAAAPAAQGALDNFCAIYSVVNAAYRVFPELLSDGRRKLFHSIVAELSADEVKDILLTGATATTLKRIMKIAIDILLHGPGLRMKMTRVKCKSERKDSIFNGINDAFREDHSAVIIGISYGERRGGHWTCIENATPNRLECYDGEMERLNYAHYGETWCDKIIATEIFQLKRVD